MKQKNAVFHDFEFRTFIFSTLSFFTTIIFTSYNLYLGFSYHATWNYGIAVYYALLVMIRAYVLLFERKISQSSGPQEKKEASRKRLFLIQSILLFLIDIALIGPITMMVLEEKIIDYSAIPAIAMAAYTTYKVTIAVRNFIKAKKRSNLSIKILKNISLVDALVSILSLQYILVMTFGNGMDEYMLPLCATSTFVIWIGLIILSVSSVIEAVKLKKTTHSAENV